MSFGGQVVVIVDDRLGRGVGVVEPLRGLRVEQELRVDERHDADLRRATAAPREYRTVRVPRTARRLGRHARLAIGTPDLKVGRPPKPPRRSRSVCRPDLQAAPWPTRVPPPSQLRPPAGVFGGPRHGMDPGDRERGDVPGHFVDFLHGWPELGAESRQARGDGLVQVGQRLRLDAGHASKDDVVVGRRHRSCARSRRRDIRCAAGCPGRRWRRAPASDRASRGASAAGPCRARAPAGACRKMAMKRRSCSSGGCPSPGPPRQLGRLAHHVDRRLHDRRDTARACRRSDS